MDNNRLIALVDADFMTYYVCHNKKKEDGTIEEKSLQECKDQVDQFFDTIFRTVGATEYMLFLTVGKCFRYQLYPDYKANRKNSDRPLYFEGVKEYMITKYKANYYPGLEADDLCIINKCHYEKDTIESNCIVISNDKDIIKCTPGKFYNPTKNEFIETNELTAYKNFWASMIIGDTTDNIKGIPGKGPKFVEKMDTLNITSIFAEYVNHFGEDEAVEQFYINYKLLKMVQTPEFGYTIPEPIKVLKEEIYE